MKRKVVKPPEKIILGGQGARVNSDKNASFLTVLDQLAREGESDQSLARRLGISPGKLSEWRSGKRGVAFKQLAKIHAKYGVDIAVSAFKACLADLAREGPARGAFLAATPPDRAGPPLARVGKRQAR